VLLDQKRTRRTVQIVAVFTSLAFAGVIFVVMGLVFFGGGEQSVADQQLGDSKERVEETPQSADAWEQLASAYAGIEDFDQAIEAATKASELDPNSFRRLQTLVSLQIRQNKTNDAITVVQEYSAAHPENADALLQLGQLAQTAGRTPLARLSYQTYLRLAPDSPSADAVRDQLEQLDAG
jgi:cytochrome c-type biogenesis protein CcmH/NrfG